MSQFATKLPPHDHFAGREWYVSQARFRLQVPIMRVSIMHTNFEETTPEWKRELREICAAIYRITLLDQTGRIRYSATGTDPEALADEAQEWLADIGAQATSTDVFAFGTLAARSRR